jgi:hypothetical protein
MEECAMAKPAVILIGADKGGVGKTTVARTLLDYFGDRNMPTRAFDTEWPRGTLKRFYPEVTEVVDVTSVADQMKIFDTVMGSTEDKVTVIDVRAGSLSSTLQGLNDIGFIELGNTGQITFVVFHILGPSIASLEEIAETGRLVGDANHFLVKNHINSTSFFEWDPTTYKSYFKKIKDAQEINIPKLNEMVCEQVEVAGVPYVSFIANKNLKGEAANYSFVLRGYVRHWLNQVWSEFDRVKLVDLVSPKSERNLRQVAG